MPFSRSWYLPLALSVGFLIMVLSIVLGWLRWPTRPRYTFLGMLIGLWVVYPYLIPGHADDSHPLGYAIVLGTLILVGYVIWKDAGSVLHAVLRDLVARRFGIGVGIVVALFFVSVTGYLSFFPEEGLAHERIIAVLPAMYQLVLWPTLEIYLPHIPLFVAVSPGQFIVVGVLSTLIGLNAAFIARHWRVEERAGITESTAGTGEVVGSCTCGCCSRSWPKSRCWRLVPLLQHHCIGCSSILPPRSARCSSLQVLSCLLGVSSIRSKQPVIPINRRRLFQPIESSIAVDRRWVKTKMQSDNNHIKIMKIYE